MFAGVWVQLLFQFDAKYYYFAQPILPIEGQTFL